MHVSRRKLGVSLLFISATLWAADDPLMGTWKVNVAKSTYSSGAPPMSTISTYEPFGKDGFRFTSDTVNAQGKASHITYVSEYDGKDYPIAGDPTRDSNSAKRIDRYTHLITNKKSGKITTTSRRVISKDGRTLTITTTGTNSQGQEVHQVQVFEKQ
jgi:hypothetical protein